MRDLNGPQKGVLLAGLVVFAVCGFGQLSEVHFGRSTALPILLIMWTMVVTLTLGVMVLLRERRDGPTNAPPGRP